MQGKYKSSQDGRRSHASVNKSSLGVVVYPACRSSIGRSSIGRSSIRYVVHVLNELRGREATETVDGIVACAVGIAVIVKLNVAAVKRSAFDRVGQRLQRFLQELETHVALGFGLRQLALVVVMVEYLSDVHQATVANIVAIHSTTTPKKGADGCDDDEELDLRSRQQSS